jgi:hypothetical protein
MRCSIQTIVPSLALALALTACRAAPQEASVAAEAPFAPGLGEIMTLQQMRHTKLWFAAEAKNWPLAAYELDELEEGFDDVVRLHPTHKDAPAAPKDLVPRMMAPVITTAREAVDHRDVKAFEAAYDGLTAGCNACHVAMRFEFNRVQRPATNPFPNQRFEPAE